MSFVATDDFSNNCHSVLYDQPAPISASVQLHFKSMYAKIFMRNALKAGLSDNELLRTFGLDKRGFSATLSATAAMFWADLMVQVQTANLTSVT